MKSVALALAALALASHAFAQPTAQGSIAINWDQCYSDGPRNFKIFGCNTNSGSDELVISAIPPTDIPLLVAATVVIDVETGGGALPPWWNFDVGCRAGPPSALSVAFTPESTSSCVDPWQGLASGGISFTSGYGSPDRGRVRTVCAVAAPVPVFASHELFIARVIIAHIRTTGTGSCLGCTAPMCLMLTSVELDQNPGVPGGNTFLILPEPDTESDLLSWQTGVMGQSQVVCGSAYCSKDMQCLNVDATSRPTWGSIKTLYR